MTRKLLVLSSQPMHDEVLEALQGASWNLCTADSARDARRELERYDFLAGLAIFWPEDSERHREELIDTVVRARRLRWVGGVPREEISRDPWISLATERLHDFVTLPLDAGRLTVILGHAYGMTKLDRLFLAQQQSPCEGDLGMIGSSPPMRAFFASLRRAARCDAPVVLYGETGTGRETAARAIHGHSDRAGQPFVAINCASVPASHSPGKISGLADAGLPGFFDIERGFERAAAMGTLYLDGISDLPTGAQARLLRLIDGEYGRRGASSADPSGQVRIICSDTRRLETRVDQGEFRPDLFYRLHVLTVDVPGLRERGDDILVLAQQFLQDIQETDATPALGFNRDALASLSWYHWPGNLRELRNRIQQAALYCRGPYITPADLQLERRNAARSGLTLQEAREEAERQAVDAAIKRNRLNMTRAAQELGVSRMTLYRLLEKHEMGVNR